MLFRSVEGVPKVESTVRSALPRSVRNSKPASASRKKRRVPECVSAELESESWRSDTEIFPAPTTFR